MEHLHTSVISTLEGQLFNWKAPIYRANQGFYGYGLAGGYATVVDGKLTPLAGDDIKYASVSFDGLMSFSDSDRLIEFEVVALKQSLESLLSERNEILALAKSMIEKAEAETNFQNMCGYAYCPKENQFKSKKEYLKAYDQYSKDLRTAYAAYNPVEIAASKLLTDLSEKIRSIYEN